MQTQTLNKINVRGDKKSPSLKNFIKTAVWEIKSLAMFSPQNLPLFLWLRYLSPKAIIANVKKLGGS
jgi:hypothetical protein